MPTRNIAMPPEIKGHPLMIEAWRNANQKNSNFIIFINGLPGTGKSTLAQYLMFMLDRGNNYEYRASLRNWCLTQKEFIAATNRNTEVGRVECWEESFASGIKDGGANSRDFMTQANKQISTVFQTMRKTNQIIIMTLPATTSFDKQARNMAHCLIHIKKNNGVYGTARVYMRDYNPVFDTVMHPFIKVRKDGRMRRVKNLYFGLPPKSWMDACNQKSDEYKDFWRKEIEDYKDEPKVNSKVQAKVDFFTQASLNAQIFKEVSRGKEKWSYGVIAKHFGVSTRTAFDWTKEFDADVII